MRTADGDVEAPLNGNSYDKDGAPRTLYTDSTGQIFIDKLPAGDYFFREVEPLSGYTVDKTDTALQLLTKQKFPLSVVK